MTTATADTPPRPWALWALLGLAVLAAAVLLGTALALRGSVARASRDLKVGQGEVLQRAVQAELRNLQGRPQADDLEAILRDTTEDGLRYVALFGPGGEAHASAGDPRGGTMLGAEDTPDSGFREVGDLVRMTFALPAPPEARPRPRDGLRPPLGPPGLGGAEGPPGGLAGGPRLVIEFEPQVTAELKANAARALAVGAGGASLLLAVCLLFWRQVRARERAERRLADERHFAHLGQMSATLAHELRNPLTSLKGHAQLLEALLPEGSREREKAHRLQGDIRRLEELGTGLLDFVRSNRIAREPCAPAALAETAVRDAGVAEQVVLETDGAPARWSLDPHRMTQVLTNLLKNAAQACPDGEPIALRITVEAGELVFRVRDRGEGLPEGADAEALFQAFVTTRTRGTGLGLAIVRQIARAHGGDVEARNYAEGGWRGAEFAVAVPPS